MAEGLGSKLRRLVAMLDDELQAVYDEMGIPFRPRFFPIMQVLLHDDSCTIGELARRIAVTQPAATQSVNEMKRLGLLAAVKAADRRQKPVQLTVAGKKLADALDPVWEAVDRAAAALDAELHRGVIKPVDDALAALEARPFSNRIREQMEK